MEVLAILKAISEGAVLIGSIRDQIDAAKDVLTSDDEAQIKAALAELQAKNDDLHSVVQAKLRGTPAT